MPLMPRFFPPSIVRTLAALCILCVLVACESTPSTGNSPSLPDTGPIWTIILDAFQGPNHAAIAQQRAASFTQSAGLTGFWVAASADKSEVNFGRYPAADSSQAHADLQRLQALTQQGRIAPRLLSIVPSSQPAQGPNAQWELRNAREPGAVYSLVIEQFTPALGPDYRRVAEQQCANLRAQNIKTFYYHSPKDSVVTLDQFTNAAAKIATSGPNAGRTEYHPFIRDTLQKQYPFLKINGTIPAQNPVPTFLIRIPD